MFSFHRFNQAFSDRLLWLTGIEVRKVARQTVRVDTHTLQNSIQLEKPEPDVQEVSANTEYAAAQEYGRPDLPNYGFTPYMRPAAAAAKAKLPDFAREAAQYAAREAR